MCIRDSSIARQAVAANYDKAFAEIAQLQTPVRATNADHVFHQYTLLVKDGRRDALIAHLKNHDIPCGVYYPIPLYKQEAFKQYAAENFELPVTEMLCQSVISLPIHTEMAKDTQTFIIQTVQEFFINN